MGKVYVVWFTDTSYNDNLSRIFNAKEVAESFVESQDEDFRNNSYIEEEELYETTK